ncbi:unnamed protein product [Sympodiomycopsis kandeliae]
MATLVNGGSNANSTSKVQQPQPSDQVVSSPGTSLHVNDWEDAQVSSWLSSLQLGSLSASFKEQGITGDVLVQLDNDALKELGVDSVGHRLALLGAIYKLKETWGLDIQQGDYRPQSEDVKTVEEPPVTVPQLIACLRQRDERILRLEQELRRTTVFLAKFQYDFTGVCRYQGLRAPTTDYAFQPFVPASASSLARKTSVTNGLVSPSSRLVQQQQQTNRHAQPSSAESPGPSSSYSSKTQAPVHTADSSFSGPQTALTAPSAVPGGASRSTATVAPPPPPPPPSSSSHQHHPATGEDSSATQEDRVRTQNHHQQQHLLQHHHPTDPISPSFMSVLNSTYQNAADDASVAGTGLDGSHSDGPLTSPGGLSSSGNVSTPTSATYPPWIRSQTVPSNGRSVPTAGGSSKNTMQGQPISPPPLGALPPAPSSTSRGGAAGSLASPGAQSSMSSLKAQQQRQQAQGSSSSSRDRADSVSGGSGSTSRDFVGTATTLGTGDSSYKSFRVTLEDPCYKVLPAALKKYKINDDWRLYALFICYGSTERCLSYDEKPLLLFQKLKEARQNPVFMLRHIRDVKSPISIANAKAAARRGSASSASGRKENKDGANANPGKVIRLNPGSNFTATAASIDKNATEVLLTGPAAQLPNPEASRSYAIAIYPYVCEREDEFDVSVGDTFLVLSKAKGWWVVQCDSHATGSGDVGSNSDSNSADKQGITSDTGERRVEIRSGWVPAGCLIETSKPLASVLDPSASSQSGLSPVSSTFPLSTNGGVEPDAVDKSSIPIPPGIITSTSTPGIMLMDYTSDSIPAAAQTGSSEASEDKAKDEGPSAQLRLRKDDRLKVFKRYNHWSYCVQENGEHARGWVPSWYIGKLSSRGASGSNPSATPAAQIAATSGEGAEASGSSTTSTPATAGGASNGAATSGTGSEFTTLSSLNPSPATTAAGVTSAEDGNGKNNGSMMISNVAGIE